MSPTVVTALIALGGVFLSGLVSFVVAHLKLTTENRLEIASCRAIRQLLRQNPWDLRTFGALKRHLPGFEDNELRRLLVAAGAVAFYDQAGDEIWGLIRTNKDRLRHKPFEEANKPKPKAARGTRSRIGAPPALAAAVLPPALAVPAAADGPNPLIAPALQKPRAG